MQDLLFQIPSSQPLSGSEKKEILIIIPENENVASFLDLLKAIVKALKLDYETQCCIHAVSPINQNIGRKLFSFNKIIVFGLKAEDIYVNIPNRQYKINQFEGQKLIFSPSLTELMSDTQKKANLWKALQVMFGT